MIKFVFLDLDDTILNFAAGEANALSHALSEIGIQPTQAILDRYHLINLAHWELLEEGRLTREEVLVQRYEQLFRELGVSADAVRCTRSYEGNLAVGHYFLPGAEEAVASLSQKYRLFLASNGTASVQAGRLTSANLYRFFISQELGADKPSKAFFDACFAAIPDFHPEEAAMVGDSLTSDIRGGLNAGLHTIWFNPHGKSLRPGISPEYTICQLSELPSLLASIQ